jgi:hypothetical protein
MEAIADVTALRPVLNALKAKGLVVSLTPEGRGHLVTHALYMPRELESLKAEAAAGGFSAPSEEPGHAAPAPVRTASPLAAVPAATPSAAAPNRVDTTALDALRQQVDSLQGQVAELRSEVSDLAAALHDATAELQRLKSDLGVG